MERVYYQSKIKCCQKLRLTVWKKNKNRDMSNVAFTDKSSFYIHNSEISIWIIKRENRIAVEEKYLKACMEAYLNIKTISLEYFGGNMDSQKYASILENNVNKIKEMFQNNRDCNNIMIANINHISHWNFIIITK